MKNCVPEVSTKWKQFPPIDLRVVGGPKFGIGFGI